jgi:hypothetical protein
MRDTTYVSVSAWCVVSVRPVRRTSNRHTHTAHGIPRKGGTQEAAGNKNGNGKPEELQTDVHVRQLAKTKYDSITKFNALLLFFDQQGDVKNVINK